MEKTNSTNELETSTDSLQPTPLKSRTLEQYIKERGFTTQEELWEATFGKD
jgi:hypothetical protein